MTLTCSVQQRSDVDGDVHVVRKVRSPRGEQGPRTSGIQGGTGVKVCQRFVERCFPQGPGSSGTSGWNEGAHLVTGSL